MTDWPEAEQEWVTDTESLLRSAAPAAPSIEEVESVAARALAAARSPQPSEGGHRRKRSDTPTWRASYAIGLCVAVVAVATVGALATAKKPLPDHANVHHPVVSTIATASLASTRDVPSHGSLATTTTKPTTRRSDCRHPATSGSIHRATVGTGAKGSAKSKVAHPRATKVIEPDPAPNPASPSGDPPPPGSPSVCGIP